MDGGQARRVGQLGSGGVVHAPLEGGRRQLRQRGDAGGVHDGPPGPYVGDLAYTSFDAAVRGAVIAIATYHKPVGMLGWAGRHAQVITGYVVSGEDPATSANFTVTGLYLSDPLHADGIVNTLFSVASLRSGSTRYEIKVENPGGPTEASTSC